MKKHLLLIIILVCAIFSLFAQQVDSSVDTDYMNYDPANTTKVTIQRNTNFQTAIKIIENLALKEERRNIVNLSSYNAGIPVQINNLPWKDAFNLLIKTTGLKLETRPGSYVISDLTSETPAAVAELNIHEKMVRINATFLSADKEFLNSLGIDWSTIYQGEVVANFNFSGRENRVPDEILGARIAHSFDVNKEKNHKIVLNALLGFIESNKKGSVLARPSITVLNGTDGHMQVGRDFSIKTRDEAGNTTDQFFSAGIILRVRPTILTEDGFEAIYLETTVEKSDAIPDALSTIINKNNARTNLILFDGEETVIGGLIDADVTRSRAGIPILKDLPWWVFGLRYIFGWNSTQQNSREIVVILKAEIVDSAKTRINLKEKIRQQQQRMRDEFKEISDELEFDKDKK